MAVQIDVLFSGSVQGVGFRFTTLRAAARLDVTGYVTNLPDGRVRMVAEGESDQLRALLAGVEEAMAGYIRDREVRRAPATGAFFDFRVR
jgi:acylphosphatase